MEKAKKILTLCIICKEGKVLLGLKKRGFAKGRWNGFGGKVENGETVEDAARREVNEECGMMVGDMEKSGILNFDAPHFSTTMEVHIFRCDEYSGEPIETEEMKPQWFGFDELPFDLMWSNDPYWYPYFRQGRKFKGKFLFNEDESINDYCLYPVNEIN